MPPSGYLNAEQPCANYSCNNRFTQKHAQHLFCSDFCKGITPRSFHGRDNCLCCSAPIVRRSRSNRVYKKIYCGEFCRLFHYQSTRGIDRFAFFDKRLSEKKKATDDCYYQSCGYMLPPKKFKAPPDEFEKNRLHRLKMSKQGRRSIHKIRDPFLRAEAFDLRRKDKKMQAVLKRLNKISIRDTIQTLVWEENHIASNEGKDG